jgi:hypothetical protein
MEESKIDPPPKSNKPYFSEIDDKFLKVRHGSIEHTYYYTGKTKDEIKLSQARVGYYVKNPKCSYRKNIKVVPLDQCYDTGLDMVDMHNCIHNYRYGLIEILVLATIFLVYSYLYE